MKTEVLFRGQDESKVWHEGDLLHGVGAKNGKMFILPIVKNLASLGGGCDPLDGFEIVRGSIGQFTGHTDINGKRIFESDICKMIWLDGTIRIDKIVKKVDYFTPEYSSQPISVLMNINITFEVIGNVFDDLELVMKYGLTDND